MLNQTKTFKLYTIACVAVSATIFSSAASATKFDQGTLEIKREIAAERKAQEKVQQEEALRQKLSEEAKHLEARKK